MTRFSLLYCGIAALIVGSSSAAADDTIAVAKQPESAAAAAPVAPDITAPAAPVTQAAIEAGSAGPITSETPQQIGASTMDTAALADATKGTTPLLLELNAFSQVDKACRVTFRVQNKLPVGVGDMALELVLLDWDGMTSRFILVRTGEVPAGRSRIRQFDMANMDCTDLGGVLLNNIDVCSGNGLTPELCLDRVAVSSLTSARFEY
jgi:hypothetical protein